MPWKACRKMDEKLRFVSRFLDGEKIAALCREFGISRVTGHKIIDRYRESELESFRTESVNHVSGIKCQPCVRSTPEMNGRGERI